MRKIDEQLSPRRLPRSRNVYSRHSATALVKSRRSRAALFWCDIILNGQSSVGGAFDFSENNFRARFERCRSSRLKEDVSLRRDGQILRVQRSTSQSCIRSLVISRPPSLSAKTVLTSLDSKIASCRYARHCEPQVVHCSPNCSSVVGLITLSIVVHRHDQRKFYSNAESMAGKSISENNMNRSVEAARNP